MSPEDDLYERAVAIVRRERKASTSYLQRRLLVGYNRAADLMERMEREGIVSAPGHRSQRQVLLGSPGNAKEATVLFRVLRTLGRRVFCS